VAGDAAVSGRVLRVGGERPPVTRRSLRTPER
jgi:hypothetical protein